MRRPYPSSIKKLGDVLTADHKVFNSERPNLFCTIVTQSWCRTFILTGSKVTQRTNCAANDEKFAKVLAARSEAMYDSYKIFSGVDPCL